jgi:hypothetical protein
MRQDDTWFFLDYEVSEEQFTDILNCLLNGDV